MDILKSAQRLGLTIWFSVGLVATLFLSVRMASPLVPRVLGIIVLGITVVAAFATWIFSIVQFFTSRKKEGGKSAFAWIVVSAEGIGLAIWGNLALVGLGFLIASIFKIASTSLARPIALAGLVMTLLMLVGALVWTKKTAASKSAQAKSEEPESEAHVPRRAPAATMSEEDMPTAEDLAAMCLDDLRDLADEYEITLDRMCNAHRARLVLAEKFGISTNEVRAAEAERVRARTASSTTAGPGLDLNAVTEPGPTATTPA